jgi:hypothetical protein
MGSGDPLNAGGKLEEVAMDEREGNAALNDVGELFTVCLLLEGCDDILLKDGGRPL